MLKRKTDNCDLVKLEDLLISFMERAVGQLNAKTPSQIETKKALMFLEKRLNRLYLGGCDTAEGDPLLAGRTWCLSCSKDEPKIKPKCQLQQSRDH